jgi:type VI secretion system secreted protein Hcp
MSDVILLEIKGVKGGSLLEGAKDHIECLSFSHSVSMATTNDVSNGERTTGKADHGDMVISKYVDQATPLLLEKLCAGKPIGQVKFKIGRTDDNQFLPIMDYVMDDVVLSNVSVGGGGGKPTETVTLNYSKIQWTFTGQKEGGGKEGVVSAKHDLKKNSIK